MSGKSCPDLQCRRESTLLAILKNTHAVVHTHYEVIYIALSLLPKVPSNTVTVMLVRYWHRTTPGRLNLHYLSLAPYDGLLSCLFFMRASRVAKSHPNQYKTCSFEWGDTRTRGMLAQLGAAIICFVFGQKTARKNREFIWKLRDGE